MPRWSGHRISWNSSASSRNGQWRRRMLGVSHRRRRRRPGRSPTPRGVRDPLHRFTVVHLMERWGRVDQVPPPKTARLHGRGLGVRSCRRELAQQDPCQQLVAALPATIHPAAGSVDGARTSRSGGFLPLPLHRSLGHQCVQVEAGRVGMYPDPLGDLGDAQWSAGIAQRVEQRTAARGFPIVLGLTSHVCPHLPFLRQFGDEPDENRMNETNGWSRPVCPGVAPSGEPRGSRTRCGPDGNPLSSAGCWTMIAQVAACSSIPTIHFY